VRWRLTDRPFATRLGNGARVRVPRGASGAGIYYRGWSEPELTSFLEHHLEPGDVMLDVGAHIGEFTLLAASRGATVHAFEPDPANAALLRVNLEDAGCSGAVTVHECAVTESDGAMRFLAHRNPSLSALWTADRAAGDALDALALPRVDVIKIDTEGAELGVLRGATTLLQRCSPTIVFNTPASAPPPARSSTNSPATAIASPTSPEPPSPPGPTTWDGPTSPPPRRGDD